MGSARQDSALFPRAHCANPAPSKNLQQEKPVGVLTTCQETAAALMELRRNDGEHVKSHGADAKALENYPQQLVNAVIRATTIQRVSKRRLDTGPS